MEGVRLSRSSNVARRLSLCAFCCDSELTGCVCVCVCVCVSQCMGYVYGWVCQSKQVHKLHNVFSDNTAKSI